MKAIILVALGGAIGSLMRYFVALLLKNFYSGEFPWHTFTVNIIGCFFIGLVFSWSLQNISFENIRLFLMVGILGGFTTYSSFGLETFDLIKQGKIIIALAYIFTTNAVGLIAVFSGYSFQKFMS
jgi:fluoride exporter